MHSLELSLEQAWAYRDFIRARHQHRLRELAWWMSSTGGPINSMDGSLPSLDELALWAEWFRKTGMPGLPTDPELVARGPWEALVTAPEYSGNWEAVSSETDRQSRRELYLDEGLTHYLLEVTRRADAAAQWEVSPEKKRRVPTVDLHSTGIDSSAGWRAVEYWWTRFWQDREKKGTVCSEYFALRIHVQESPACSVRAQSVLTPLLDVPSPPPLTPPRFQLPSHLTGTSGSPYFYSLGEASRDSARRALMAAGFRVDGGDILEHHLVGGARLLHLEGTFEAVLISTDSRLVAIAMLPWGSPPWLHLSAEVALLRASPELAPVAATPQLVEAVGVDVETPSLSERTPSEACDMAFAYPIRRRHLDRQEKWKPLPVAALVKALQDLGIHGDDGSISADHLIDGAELAQEDYVVTASVVAPGGKPRAVWFEVHNITQDEWDAFQARMTALARSTRARFCTDGELFGDE